MKAAGSLAAAAIEAFLTFWCGEAEAYRPFDGTDAAVAETGEMEIELGPVEYLREGAECMLLAPDLRINYGFISGWEAALEGKLTHGLTAGVPGASLVESQALLKGVLREGSLQEKPGPRYRNPASARARPPRVEAGNQRTWPADKVDSGEHQGVGLDEPGAGGRGSGGRSNG